MTAARTPNREGAALILAIILLAGLLLLGLPFLFSQSASLAGSRSFAYQQQATVGRDAAEQLGIAVAAARNSDRFALSGNAGATTYAVGLPATAYQQVSHSYNVKYDTGPLAAYNPQPTNAITIGTLIVDEQSKLDVNHLDAATWSRLLREAKIQDWDDDLVWDSEDLNPDSLSDTTLPEKMRTTNPSAPASPTTQADDEDSDNDGELAEALANLRFTLPFQRITDINQLLLPDADPGHNTLINADLSDYSTNAPTTGTKADGYGFRRALTRSELETLRPYLSVHVRGQAAMGLIDLGSTVAEHGGETWLDSDVRQVVGAGTVLAWDNLNSAHPIKYQRHSQLSASSNAYPSDWIRVPTVWLPSTPSGPQPIGLAISAPASVNLHHAQAAVLAALGGPAGISGVVNRYGDLDPATQLPFLNPFRKFGIQFSEALPIDIGSFGLVQVDSAATALDPRRREAAERRRRVIAQALPQEAPLERRWVTQGDLHALVAGRHTSRMSSWPRAVERVNSIQPYEPPTAGPGTTPATPSEAPVGLRPATEPSLATGFRQRFNSSPSQRQATHLAIDWRLPFGADEKGAASVLTEALTSSDLVNVPPLTAMRPDGLLLDAATGFGARLYPEDANGNTPKRGPLRAVSSVRFDVRGRHLSFWFKPASDWTSADIVPLLEAKMPAGNAIDTVTAIAGQVDLQNRLGVYYDGSKQALVMVLAPPTVEHLLDVGPTIRTDDAASLDLDERSLALIVPPSSTLPRLAPAARYVDKNGATVTPGSQDSLFATKVSPLYQPNCIVHLYKVNDPATGGSFFRKDRWYHLNVIMGGDRPGQFGVILDGLVGRDISRQTANSAPPTDVMKLNNGDHLTLPALPLKTEIPYVDLADMGPGKLALPKIVVDGILGLEAEDIFPARGILRIDDEYFSYNSVDGNEFLDCRRAQRQNTQVNHTDLSMHWPRTQGHLAGSLVVPGGYRLAPIPEPRPTGVAKGHSLFRGGSLLADILRNGDPDPAVPPADAAQYRWKIWAAANLISPFAQIGTTSDYTWPANSNTIPISTDLGCLDQFPLRGIVLFRNRMLYYGSRDGDSLDDITDLTGASWETHPPRVWPENNQALTVTSNDMNERSVLLLSLRLTGANPLDAGRYNLTSEGRLLQLTHPSGRVEWIEYSHFLKRTAGMGAGADTFFVVNVSGWHPGTRGRQRTDFVGSGRSKTLLTNADIFPEPTGNPVVGTMVIPVQTAIGPHGHWVATGDVMTIIPKMFTPLSKACQAVVRFAANDGYDGSGSGANDTINEYFAFDRPLPDLEVKTALVNPETSVGHHADSFDFLVWPCWSGDDLSPQGPTAEPRGQMPRLDLWAAGRDLASSTANLTLGGGDSAYAMTIDAVVAGDLKGISSYSNAQSIHTADTALPIGIIRAIINSNESIAPAVALDAIVEANRDNFFTDPMGLVRIDGEVFAYRQLSNAEAQTTFAGKQAIGTTYPGESQDFSTSDALKNSQRFAKLIGAGLLDDVDALSLPHSLPKGPQLADLRPHRGMLPSVCLPMGPVAQIKAPITDNTWWTLFSGYGTNGGTEYERHEELDAPYIYACDRNGTAANAQVMAMAGPRLEPRTIAPNTSVTDAWYASAPWLRGLYHTDVTMGNTADAIAIGWWPRYPSAMPATIPSSLTPSQREAYYRSRAFAWAGFPFALRNARFDAGLINGFGVKVAEADVLPTGTDAIFGLEARAAAGPFAWDSRPSAAMQNPNTGSTPINLDAAFLGNPHFPSGSGTLPVQGAELRIFWRYRTGTGAAVISAAPSSIAAAGNSAPMIGAVHLRALAPSGVIAVEDAR